MSRFLFSALLPHALWRLTAVGTILATLPGCSSRFGPRTVEKTVPHYGEAVETVEREELLSNIVRRHYHETPQFMAFQGISHTRQIEAGVTVGSTFLRPKGWNAADAAIDAAVVDYPTFSINPQQGREYAKQLHDNLPLDVLPKMINAGYSMDLVFCLLVQDIAGLRGIGAGNSFPPKPPSSRFLALLNSLKVLDDKNQLRIRNVLWEEPEFAHPFAPEVFSPEQFSKQENASRRYTSTDEGKSFLVTSEKLMPALVMERSALSTEAGRTICDLLRISPAAGRRAWALQEERFVSGQEPGNNQNYIPVTTRSFYGILNLLALGIGCETNTSAKQGASDVAAALITERFRIQVSGVQPSHAFAAVKSHGYWFFIDEADQSSQHIFNALSNLYQLQVATSSSSSGSSAPSISVRTR